MSIEAMCKALRGLVAEPDGLRLFGQRNVPGVLASNSAAAKRLADRLVAEGLVDVEAPVAEKSHCRITDQGRQWLLDNDDPRVVLEDLLRVMEAQRDHLTTLETTLHAQGQRFAQQCWLLTRLLERLAIDENLVERIGFLLDDYRRSGHPADCSIAGLFDRLQRDRPELTVGQFHDALRTLAGRGTVRLSPWTGPLYELPRPDLALLIGHEVLYYVHRVGKNAA